MRKLNYYIVEGGHDQDPDPEQAGRVRLRKMGAHGEGVETSHLPFSQLSSPVSGGGPFEFNRPPPPGTIVLGFDAGDSVGYAFPIGIPHGVHEKGATIPGNDALPFLSKAKDMISQNMGIPADVENILGSNRTGIQKLTKELKEKTALFSQGTTYGLPGHGAIFSLAGIRNNPIEKIQTALDQATDAIDSSKLEGLGEQLNLGSLLGQVDSSSLPKSLQDAMGNISQLLPQDLTSVQPEWGSMIGGLADPSKALSSITDKLSGIGNTGQLLDAIKGFQGGDFLSSVGSDALKQLDVATPFGSIKQLIDSKGNILSDASGIQDLIKQFSGLLGGILQGGKGQKLFSDSGTPLPEMLGRMKDMTKQTDMTQFLQQLSNLNLSKLRGREVGTSNGNTQASRNFIMDFGKQTFSELDNMVVPFKTKSSTGSSAQSFAVAVNNSGASSNVESGSSSTNYLTEADGWFPTVASLTSDNNTRIGYAGSNALTTVIEGDYIEAGGFRYRVAASDAVDHHVTTAGGVKLYVLTPNAMAWGPSGNGVTDDTDYFEKIEASNFNQIDLDGKSYYLVSYWEDNINGIKLTKDYKNGTLLLDGRKLVFDTEASIAMSSSFSAKLPKSSTSRQMALYAVNENEYYVYRHLTGTLWYRYQLKRTANTVPFNVNDQYIVQIMSFQAAQESGVVYTGNWNTLNSASYAITTNGTSYVGGRAQQAISSGDYVEHTFTGGGDIYVIFTGRASGNYVNVLLNNSQDYLILQDDGTGGNSYFDSYTSTDLTYKNIVHIATGVPVGEHTIRLTVSSLKNANSSGNRYFHSSIAWNSPADGPWSPNADAPKWKENEVVLNSQERRYNGNYYYATNTNSSFVGNISGTTLTANSINSGTINIGAKIYGNGIINGTTVVSQLTGSAGSTGTYEVSLSQTVSNTTIFGYGATTGNIAPTHTSGTMSDGKVDWVYKPVTSYLQTNHRIVAAGSQLEYAYEIKPNGASSFEDVGGALHGNETQTDFKWFVSGRQINPLFNKWYIGEDITIIENIDTYHSQIDSGSTVVIDTELKRRFSKDGMWISHKHILKRESTFGYFYSAMFPVMHYTAIGQKFAVDTIWSPGDGYRKCSDYYGRNNPFVGVTKDILMVCEGNALQADGIGGVPVAANTSPLKFTAWVEITPESVDYYRRAGSVYASKAMNTSAGSSPPASGGTPWSSSTPVSENDILYNTSGQFYKVITSGTTGSSAPTHTSGSIVNGTATLLWIGTGYSSLTSKIYFERFAQLNPQTLETNEVINCDAFYGLQVYPK